MSELNPTAYERAGKALLVEARASLIDAIAAVDSALLTPAGVASGKASVGAVQSHLERGCGRAERGLALMRLAGQI